MPVSNLKERLYPIILDRTAAKELTSSNHLSLTAKASRAACAKPKSNLRESETAEPGSARNANLCKIKIQKSKGKMAEQNAKILRPSYLNLKI
jgi:hypothetical protein